MKDTTANYIPNGFWRWKFGKAPPLGARDGENQVFTDTKVQILTHLIVQKLNIDACIRTKYKY